MSHCASRVDTRPTRDIRVSGKDAGLGGVHFSNQSNEYLNFALLSLHVNEI